MTVSDHLHKLGEYSKSVTAVVTSFTTTLGAASSFFTEVTGGDFGLASVVATLTGVSVWFVKNQANIDKAGDVAGDLTER